jgi:hypothetical protein
MTSNCRICHSESGDEGAFLPNERSDLRWLVLSEAKTEIERMILGDET